MTGSNLACVFGLNLIWSPKGTPSFSTLVPINIFIGLLIDFYPTIFSSRSVPGEQLPWKRIQYWDAPLGRTLIILRWTPLNLFSVHTEMNCFTWRSLVQNRLFPTGNSRCQVCVCLPNLLPLFPWLMPEIGSGTTNIQDRALFHWAVLPVKFLLNFSKHMTV